MRKDYLDPDRGHGGHAGYLLRQAARFGELDEGARDLFAALLERLEAAEENILAQAKAICKLEEVNHQLREGGIANTRGGLHLVQELRELSAKVSALEAILTRVQGSVS